MLIIFINIPKPPRTVFGTKVIININVYWMNK